MTFQKLFPLMALFVGLVLGIFGTKSLLPRESSANPPQGHPTKSNSRGGQGSSLDSTPSLVPSNSSLAQLSSFTGSIKELMDLVESPYTGGNSAKFILTIESLSESQVANFWKEIEVSYANDSRAWQARNALMRRWASLSPDRALSAALDSKNYHVRSQMLTAVTSVIASQDPERAIALAEGLKSDRDRKALFGSIAASIASKEPERALELLKRSGPRMSHYYNGVFLSWMDINPTAAREAAKKIKDPQGRQQAQSAIASFLARENPEEGWNYAQSVTGTLRNQVVSQVVSQIALEDPQQALSFLSQIPQGQKREQALQTLFSGWVSQDPQAAKDWLNTLPEREKITALEGNMWNLTQGNLDATIKLVESLKPSYQTANLYSKLVGQWAQMDPEAAQKWVKQLPLGKARQAAQRDLLRTLSNSNPNQAMKYLEGERITRQDTYTVSQLAAKVAAEDPEKAFAWLQSLEVNGSAYQKIVGDTVSQLATTDLPLAASHTLGIEDQSTRKEAINDLISAWSNQDHESAQAWIDTNLAAEERLDAYGSLVGQLSYRDPVLAKQLFEKTSQGLSPEEVKKHFDGTMNQISNGWGRTDPEAATAWVLAQPADENRHDMIANIVDEWAEFDTTGAANFVLSLDEGEERDSAIGSLVRDLRQWDPESAFLWADSVSDPDQRKRQIRNAVREWQETDPTAAREAVLGADLTEEIRNNILKTFDTE